MGDDLKGDHLLPLMVDGTGSVQYPERLMCAVLEVSPAGHYPLDRKMCFSASLIIGFASSALEKRTSMRIQLAPSLRQKRN